MTEKKTVSTSQYNLNSTVGLIFNIFFQVYWIKFKNKIWIHIR